MAAPLAAAAAATIRPRTAAAAAEFSPVEHRRVDHFGGAPTSAPKPRPLDLLDDEGSGRWTARSSIPPPPPDNTDAATQLLRVQEQLQHLSQQLEQLQQLPRQLDGMASSQGRLERALGQMQQQLNTKDASRDPNPEAVPDIEAGVDMDRMRSIAQSPAARSIQRGGLDNNSHAPSRVNVRRATTKTLESYMLLPHQWLSPMHPDHKPRLILDFVFVVMTIYDCWAVPYQMAWRVEYTGWFAVWTYLTLVWWTIDMVLGFFVGYYRKSRIEMRLNKIAWHYLKNGFGFNLVAVTADFIVLAMVSRRQYSGETGVGLHLENVARICKVSRLFRMIMLLQRGGLSQFYNRAVIWLQERGVSRQIQAFSTVVQLVVLIVWVNHLGACFWHYAGREAIATWYTSMEIENASRGFDYLLSYYWSVSAIISGGSIMELTKSSEVLCVCVFILFGLLFLSVLISALAATVMDLNMSNKERKEKLRMLHRYFYQHQVEAPVAIPIEKQAIERMGNVARIRAVDVDVLAFVSPAMRAELRSCVYGPGLSRNAFITSVNSIDSGIIKELCFNERALTQMNYDPGTPVFEPETEAPGAYYVNCGSLEYTNAWTAEERSNTTGNTRTNNHTQEVAQGQWVCESALHTQWMHCGWMEASTVCELLVVAGDGLMKVLGIEKQLLTIARHYGEAIIMAIRQEPLSMLSDLHMAAIDHASIILSMPLKSRIALSQAALEALDKSQHWGFLACMQPRRDRIRRYQLEKELSKGKCDVMINEEGRVLRVVSLCLVRLERADGRVLVEIGDMKDGKLSMGCKLPGTRVRSQELPHDALKRLIQKQFAHLEPERLATLEQTLIAQASRAVNSEEKVSQNYGINSRYLRYEFGMQIESELFSEDGSRALARSSSRTSGRFGLRRMQAESAESLQVSKYEAFAKVDPDEPDRVTVLAWIDPEALAFLSSNAGDAKMWDWVYGFQSELAELQSEFAELFSAPMMPV